MSTATLPGTQPANLDAWGQPVQGAGGAAGSGGDDWAANAGGTVDPFEGFDQFDGSEAKAGGGLIDCEGAYHLEIAEADLRRDKDSGQPELNRNGRYEIRCRLVCLHSTPGQSPAGSAMWHGLEIPNAEDREHETKNGGNMFAALTSAIGSFCLGVGAFAKRTIDGKEVIVDQETGTTKWNLRTLPQRLKGRQVVGRPKRRDWESTDKQTGQPKKGFEMVFAWGNGVSQIGDPQNAMTPLNEEAMAGAGLKRFQGPSAATQAAASGVKGAAKGAKSQTAAAPQQAPRPAAGPVPAPVSANQYDDL